MAGGPSVFLAGKLLDKSLKDTAFTPPGTFYVALFTTASETFLRSNTIASANEVANAGSYARKPVTAGQIGAASAGVSTITIDIIFNTATAGWGTIYQAALMDVVTHGSGNIYYFGPLSASADVQSGDVLKIPASTFTIAL